MPDIEDGGVVYVQGSAREPYELKNVGGSYSCTCPAWRNAGGPIDRRTCKHLKAYRGVQAETARLGTDVSAPTPRRVVEPPTGEAGTEGAGAEPPVLLAHKWEPHVDLTGWWMSEKLDGVRAYWDGKRFVSRLGNAFVAPPWFTAGFPDHPLDGELWVGRKQFQDTVSIVRRMDASDDWKRLRFLVFDAPHLAVGFEDRVAWIQAFVSRGAAPYAVAVPHERCENIDHLRRELARVEGLGGEGLMMRQPGSRYEVGRSHTLLKVKTFHDAEGRVVAYEPGKGKHKGRVGALVVEMPDKTRFNVGTGLSDDERRDPPPLGAIVTYRYQELSRDGVPRFPSYVGRAVDKAAPTAVTAAPSSKPAPVPTPAPSGGALAGRRMFECVEGTSSKFWEVWIDGNEVRTRYGRIGTTGQVTVKDAGSADGARKLHDKLVREKTGKGYVETGGGTASAPGSGAASATPPAPAPPPPAPAPAPPGPSIVVGVHVAGGGGDWRWTFPGDEQALRTAWSAGHVPLHLLPSQRRSPATAFAGAVERGAVGMDVERLIQLEEEVAESVLYIGDDALGWTAAVPESGSDVSGDDDDDGDEDGDDDGTPDLSVPGVCRIANPTDATVASLDRAALRSVTRLILTEGEIGDAGALSILLLARDVPDLARIEVDENRIGIKGLRTLSLLGDRVAPGRHRAPAGGDLIQESFRHIDWEQLGEVADAWIRLLLEHLTCVFDLAGFPGELERASKRWAKGGELEAGLVELRTEFGRILKKHADAGPRSEPIVALITEARDAMTELSASMDGDYGNDYGSGFVALADALVLASGTRLTAHARGPIALRADADLHALITRQIDDLRTDGTLRRPRGPDSGLPPVPVPASLANDDLLAALGSSECLADLETFADLLARIGDATRYDALLADVTIEDGSVVGATEPAKFLRARLVADAPDGSSTAARLRAALTTARVAYGRVPIDAAPFARLPALRTLLVAATEIVGLEALAGAPQLTTVAMPQARLPDLGWLPERVTALSIGAVDTLEGIERCRSLRVAKIATVSRGLERLSGLPLVYLDVAVPPWVDPAPIFGLPQLVGLELAAPGLKDGKPLSALTKLQVLTLSQGPKSLAGADLPELVHLTLGRGERDLAGAKLPRLRYLLASSIKALPPSPLEQLTFEYSGPEAGLSSLREMPLRWLDLTSATLPDGLRALSGHPTLEHVRLYTCRLTDVSAFATLPALRSLVLCCLRGEGPEFPKLDVAPFEDHPVRVIHVEPDNVNRARMKKKLKDKIDVRHHPDVGAEPAATWLAEWRSKTLN